LYATAFNETDDQKQTVNFVAPIALKVRLNINCVVHHIPVLQGVYWISDQKKPWNITQLIFMFLCCSKRFCACDGVTIWDERDRILARAEGKQSTL
jgi:hypothetical protein